MELKKIIEISRQKIIETHNAFYAGHPEVAKSYLVETYNLLCKYFRVLSEHDITELVDTETPLEGLRDSVWTDWFERLKLTNPPAYRFFPESLTQTTTRNCDFELKNESGFCLQGFIAGEGFIPTTL